VEGPVEDARIVGEPWREDDLVVIAPPAHPLATARRPVPPGALATEPFLLRERGSGTRVVAAAALAAHGVAPRAALTLGSTEAVKQGVAAGLGLAVVSRAAAADQLALGRVGEVRVAGLTIRRQLTLLRLAGRRASATAAAVEARLQSEQRVSGQGARGR
jgi:DNA-binding transcriptional LysR family regulator